MTLLDWLHQHRRLHETRRALLDLDARALRDLGLDASEAGSVAAEAAGLAPRQRRLHLDVPCGANPER